MSLLSIRLTARYPASPRPVLDDLHLDIQPGEAVGLIGESGSGKSTLALAVLRLLQLKGGSASGWLLFKGRDLLQLRESEMRQVRGREISLVLQSAATSLNPALRIGTQFREAWCAHASSSSFKTTGMAEVAALLADVNLPATADFLNRYPRELSIGQAQRVLIALALLHRPDLLIADEPTSALDVITQREVLELLNRLRRDYGMATLFISHDLLSVAAFCHRVAILENGAIVETGETAQVFAAPQHQYTKRLIAALPQRPSTPVSDDEEEDQSASPALYDTIPAEYRERQSLANLARLAEVDKGTVIPFPAPNAMLKSEPNQPPCAEASKPSAVPNRQSQTKK